MGVGRCVNDQILPFILKMLGEKIEDLKTLLRSLPDQLVHTNREQTEHLKQLEQEREQIIARTTKLVDRIPGVDEETFRTLNEMFPAMQEELKRLDSELDVENFEDGKVFATKTEKLITDYSRDDLKALANWWSEFNTKAVSVPVAGAQSLAASFHQDPESEETAVLVDPRIVNDALSELETKVEVWWVTK